MYFTRKSPILLSLIIFLIIWVNPAFPQGCPQKKECAKMPPKGQGPPDIGECGIKKDPVPSTYDAPCSAKYPFGDEGNNQDQLETPPVNEERTSKEIKTLGGRCPVKPEANEPKQSHIPCPPRKSDEPVEVLYSSMEDATPEVECKKCDLTLNPQNTAVYLRCYSCYELPKPEPLCNKEKGASKTNEPDPKDLKDLVYLVYFVGVTNYTDECYKECCLPPQS